MKPKSHHAQARGTATLSRAAAAFYSEFVETFPRGFAVLYLRNSRDPNSWKLVACNRLAARVVGSDAANYLRLPLDELASLSPDVSRLYRDVIIHRRPKAIGFVQKPGRSAPHKSYSLTALPLPERCVGILFEDATAALRAIRGRAEAESRLMQICGSARAILWSADPATFEFRYVSPEAPLVLGYWVERWQHERDFLHNHVHAEDWGAVRSTLARVAEDALARRLDFRMIHADGRQMWFRTHVQLANVSMGRPELRGVMIDITEQKRGELGAREFSLKVLRGQELERKRISFELHENIAQSLGSIQWMLSALAQGGAAESARAEKFQECIQLTRSCIDQIRSVSYELQPPVLEMLGLVPALQWHARRFAEQSGVHVRLEAPSNGVERLGEEAELALFRVFEECLSNVQRHARTASALGRVRFESDSIVLEVEDRGVGVPADLFEHLERGGFGAGLLKSREIVRRLQGNLEVESNGRGTLVRATVPRSLRRSTLAGTLSRAGRAAFDRNGIRKGVGPRVARPVAKD
jgi:PAS domain S-box-containing protein